MIRTLKLHEKRDLSKRCSMVDIKKFLEEGGTKVAKTPEEARKLFAKTEIGKAIISSRQRTRSTSGGGRILGKSTKGGPETFRSTILNLNFTSAFNRARAEAAFAAEQARQRIARAKAAEAARLKLVMEERARQRKIKEVARLKAKKKRAEQLKKATEEEVSLTSKKKKKEEKEKIFLDPRTGKPLGFVFNPNLVLSDPNNPQSKLVPRKQKISEKVLVATINEARRLRTKKQLGTITKGEEAKLIALVPATAIAGIGVLFQSLKQIKASISERGKKLIKDPKSITKLPKAIKKKFEQEGKQFGQLLKVSPGEALAKIGTEILILKGTGKALKIVGKLNTGARVALSPRFRGIKKSVITIPSKTKGRTINIKIVTKTTKKIGIPIKKQIELAGKPTLAVSAQADRLIPFIRGRRIIRKPIPNEALLSKRTKILLSKFDKGNIKKRDLIKLQRRLKIETKGQGSLLERSFFASPEGKLRVSRLGVQQKEASLLDILAGDVTFRSHKPQILLFEKVRVQKLPKSLKTIERKLRAGKTLTSKEANEFLKFQLKPTGKFKPVGKLSREPEITIAPGELIKREKRVGFTLVKGKRIPIVRAKIIKPKPETRKLLKKLEKGKITRKEIRKLNKNLKKETGFKTKLTRKTKISRRLGEPRARVRLPKRIPRRLRRRIVTRPRPRPRPRLRPPTRPRPRKRTPTRPRPSGRPRPRPSGRPRPTPRRPPKRPPIRPPRTIPKTIPLRFGKKRISKKKKQIKKQVFNVFVKSKKKFVRVNRRPLTKSQAKDRGSFVTDHTTANTFKLKATGRTKKPGKLTKGEAGRFIRTRKKFRQFRVKRKKKIVLKNKFIEKRGRPRIDTRGEKRGLSIAKFLKQRGIKVRKRRKGGKK